MTTRDAFEAWFLAYRQSTWRPLKSDPRKDMPAHWNVNGEMDCWRGWKAATLAERERCALVCAKRNLGDGSREDQEAINCANDIKRRGDA